MPADIQHRSIEKAIASFAQAYEALENLQALEARKDAREALLPQRGDQKTGLIGEYWAIRYARAIFKDATVIFAGHSQKGWDLKVVGPRTSTRYIQIKTVSDFGEGKLSPICSPSKKKEADGKPDMADYWDELWLLRLDRQFQPIVLWRLKPEHVAFNGASCLKGKTVRRHPDERSTGSTCFKWDEAKSVTANFTGKGGK